MAKKTVADDFGVFLVSQHHLTGTDSNNDLDTASLHDRFSDAVGSAKDKLEADIIDPGINSTPYVIYKLVPVLEISAVNDGVRFIEKKL